MKKMRWLFGNERPAARYPRSGGAATVLSRARCEGGRSAIAVVVLVVFLMAALFAAPARAAIVYISQSSGGNNAIPTDGSAGPLTIPRPAGVVAGHALIVSIAARPRSMTVTVPAGWVLMTSTQQPAGGVSTAPGGMTLLTYYKVATTGEPASYTWMFANTNSNDGGGAVGGILAFSGVDTSANPINVWSERLTNNGLTHATNSITPTLANTMLVSSISYLSASSFGNPSGIAGITERLDQAAPANDAVGTTIQMSTAPWAPINTATGASQATATANADTGVGHLMALRPSSVDPGITKTRSGPLNPGGSASYTLTVINNGLNSEPGPITVVDTLPAGLTYTSFSGAGWACGAVGQVVTCARAGALAAGATATPLVLNVNVSAGASGTLTNTATVSGTGGDGNTANNTATDSYTIPLQTYAYYAMDETTWGAVTDSSGNGRNGTALGAAVPTGYPPASPPDSAIAGTPGTCGAGSIPLTAGSGVDTGIDINSLGNAGSITFWYSSNTAWNDGTDRMLLDASNNLGAGGSDKHFYLVKGDGGELRFGLEDDTDDNELVSSGGNSFPANQWHHIAITWDWNVSDRMYLYLDGVEEANTGINDNIGDYATLYLGTTHAGIAGTDIDFTTNTANGYLDEVRLYTSALTAAQVTADMNATHPCAAVVDHFSINIGAAAASTCSAKSVTITAEDAANVTIAGYTGTINIATSSNHGDWSQPTATGTLNNGAADDGAASYTFVAGDNGVKILDLTNHHADDLTISVVDNTVPSTLSTSATVNFRDNAFVITNDTIQVAGRDQAMSVAMWRRDPSTGDCAIATGYTGAKNLDAWLALDVDHPAGATVPTIGALTLPTAAPAVNPGSNNLALTFTNGEANFNLSTADVGKYALNLRDDTRTFATGVDILGASNTITTRPFALHASVSGNPGASAATGTVFTSAGTNFTATVRGVLWQAADDANDDGAPDSGADLTNNGVTPRYAWLTTLSPTTPFTPATPTDAPPGTGTAGAINNGGVAQASFSGGSATVATLQYTEVGSFTMRAAASDYLNSPGVNITTANGVVGRFTPAYFDVAVTHGCSAGNFTYSGQPFLATVVAYNALNAITLNFHSAFGFAKDVTISNAGDATNFSNNVAVGASAFTSGSGSTFPVTNPLTGPNPPMTYAFAAKETAQLTLTLRGVDTDNISSAGHTEQQTNVRSGRILIQNAFGSELVDLAVPLRAQYYADANTGWVTNTGDVCTAVTVAFSNYQGSLAAGETCVQDTGNPGLSGQGCAAAGPLPERFSEPPASGNFNLFLRAPGGGNNGSVDVSTDLSAMSWLQFDWNGGGLANPQGRATFGIFKGSPRHIYLRELY